MDPNKMEFLLDKVKALLLILPDELQDKFADHLIDFVENYVSGSASPIDDMIVLPICKQIREHFGIPDND